MAKREKALKVKKERKSFNEIFDKDFTNALAFILVFILLFSAGNFTGMLLSIKDGITVNQVSGTTDGSAEVANPTQAPTQAPTPAPTQASTAAPTQAPTQAPTNVTAAPTMPPATTNAPTQAPTAAPTEAPTAAPQGSSMTTEEIVALFNKASNGVKENATKVTRNFKKQQHLAEHTVLPSVAQSVGSGLIDTLLKDNNEAKVYDTKERIIEKYPIGNDTVSARVTPADLKEATCTDDGTSYNITLKFIDGTDPVGSGVANAFTVMTVESVKESVSMVESASFKFFEAVIQCKIDYATGRLTWSNYHLPFVMSAHAKMVIEVDASVGVLIEEDFTIEY